MNLATWKRLIHTPFGVALGSCILLQGFLMAIVNPILPIVISNRLGLDKPGVATFYLINILIGVVVTLSTGYLSDGAVPRHRLVMLGGGVGALGYFGVGAATLPIHAYIAGPLMVGLAVLFPQLFAVAKAGIVAGWEREAQVMGITALRTLFSLGFILGTALSSVLGRVIDFQTIFFLISGGILFLTFYAARVLSRIEAHIAHQADVKTADGSAPRRALIILPLYALIIPLVALIVLQGADSTRIAYLALIMFQLFHDASIAPLMFGIAATVELFTMSFLGYLSSKFGEKKVIAGGSLVGAVYYLIMASTQSLPVMFVSQVLYAFFVAALLGVAMAYIQGLLAHRAGLGGSLYVAVLNLGSLVGILSPLLVTGYDQKIFFIPAILCVTGALLLLAGDRTAQIEKRLLEASQPIS
jgi:MFS transporter, SET family, sugar efflux transporter